MTCEENCTYEVAKLAKEKGFPQDPDKNDHCLMYCWDGLRNIHSLAVWIVWEMEEYDHENLYAAPTQSLLQRWLREEKGVIVYVFPMYMRWYWGVKIVDTEFWHNVADKPHDDFATYEEAMEVGLKYALEKLV